MRQQEGSALRVCLFVCRLFVWFSLNFSHLSRSYAKEGRPANALPKKHRHRPPTSLCQWYGQLSPRLLARLLSAIYSYTRLTSRSNVFACVCVP